ncbi:hypothetical protein JR316_0005065 [Psilocybe cubensis]|uniref:BTB domain-containing protein n=2 Tax=Psilocybe cubensis TaxID=181762 RepID=A0A8H8CM01_PSICU|nr:hypothetical protein JR316_0005065 [Psilocybe cubensis]KAH9482965.1 hypothetical protein JR316_0005065 [Psilocybe cubensis]
MDPDWESVLQFVSDPLDADYAANKHAVRSPIQVPTPPQSNDGSPVVDDPADAQTLVSVSTTFFPGAQHLPVQPDTVLLSSDNVFFYVHSHLLIAASENGFRGHLPQSPSTSKHGQNPIISLPENSKVLNVILHAVYDMSCAHYSPTFPCLISAVNRLPIYGIRPKSRIAPSMPLFSILLSHAPLYPIELYALAASFDLYDLAVSTSSHLLSFPLASITDEMAERIGPVYLKRLFFLHFGRSDALKRVLLPPPHPHAPTPLCDFTEQKKLTRAWALASAYLAWDARPDLSTSTMESALRPLAEHLTCEGCQQALRDRIKNLVVQWSVVKRTI